MIQKNQSFCDRNISSATVPNWNRAKVRYITALRSEIFGCEVSETFHDYKKKSKHQYSVEKSPKCFVQTSRTAPLHFTGELDASSRNTIRISWNPKFTSIRWCHFFAANCTSILYEKWVLNFLKSSVPWQWRICCIVSVDISLQVWWTASNRTPGALYAPGSPIRWRFSFETFSQ